MSKFLQRKDVFGRIRAILNKNGQNPTLDEFRKKIEARRAGLNTAQGLNNGSITT